MENSAFVYDENILLVHDEVLIELVMKHQLLAE